MVTQIETETKTQTTTNTGRRIFAGLNSDTATEYKRPSFSSIDFEDVEIDRQTSYQTTDAPITIEKPKTMDMLTIEKQIEQRPQTPIKIKLNARGKIIISVLAICICALVAFMIGNIVTISQLNETIRQKEEYVYSQQQQVDELQANYDQISNEMYDNALSNGYQTIESDQIISVDEVLKIEKDNAEIDGNWFDNLCNFLSNFFN